MAESEVIARVISQKGNCQNGHKVGDEFVMEEITPAGMCGGAYCTMFPYFFTLKFGGSFPWEKDPDTALIACPDPDNPVVFELRRVKP